MSSTEQASDSLSALMQRYDALQAEPALSQEELEELLHTEVWRQDWHEVLRLLELTQGVLSRGAAGECIGRALYTASAEEFASILERLPTGEYTEKDTYFVTWSPTGEVCRRLQWKLTVQGTMVMHAVACGRPELLELLLDHGYDVNCASSRAAAALLTDRADLTVSYGTAWIPFQPYTARPESCIRLCRWDTTPDDIPPMIWEGATPLALAILMGQAECARILVERGAWLEEAPAVSSVMYLFWMEQEADYQAARQVVLAAGDHARHRPVLWVAGETCSPRQLEELLTSWKYSRSELVQAARNMVESMPFQNQLWKSYSESWRSLYQRILCLGRICPEAIQDRSVIGPFLGHFLLWKQADVTTLLSVLEGATLDLSEMGLSAFELERTRAQRCLKELAAHCTLVMDRDAMDGSLSPDARNVLLSFVSFLPPSVDCGVSALTQTLLRTGDLRRIRSALKSGLIPPEESTEELLRCQQALGLPVSCRSALLTTPRPPKQKERGVPYPAVLRNRWFANVCKGPGIPLLEETDWQPWFWPTVSAPCGKAMLEAAGVVWQVDDVFFAACMAGRTDIVAAWLRVLPKEELRNTSCLCDPDRERLLVLTPLCAAALAGQEEIVKLLLAHGAEVREELCGCPSVCFDGRAIDEEGTGTPLNPALAAALGSHWKLLRELLAGGAVWEPDSPETQSVWNRFR